MMLENTRRPTWVNGEARIEICEDDRIWVQNGVAGFFVTEKEFHALGSLMVDFYEDVWGGEQADG